jgi:hypothetical protein
MKKFILGLIFILGVQLQAFSQTDYPRYEKDSMGNYLVVMTVEQAQFLDNATDLLYLFEQLNSDIVNYDSVCVKVIRDKDIVISEQTIAINQLKELVKIKNQEVDNLNKTIVVKDSTIQNLDSQILKTEEQLTLSKKKIRELKTKMWIGGSGGGLAIIALVLAIIL